MPVVAFDDLGLEGLLAQIRYLQIDLLRLGVEFSTIAAGPGIRSFWAMPVVLGATQDFRFRIQHCIQRALNSASADFAEVTLDPSIINRNSLVQGAGVIIHGGGYLWLLVRFSAYYLIK